MSKFDLIKQASERLRALSIRNAELEAELASHVKYRDAEKIAADMASKGLLPVEDVKPTAQAWIDQEMDLGTMEKAAEIAESIPQSN